MIENHNANMQGKGKGLSFALGVMDFVKEAFRENLKCVESREFTCYENFRNELQTGVYDAEDVNGLTVQIQQHHTELLSELESEFPGEHEELQRVVIICSKILKIY